MERSQHASPEQHFAFGHFQKFFLWKLISDVHNTLQLPGVEGLVGAYFCDGTLLGKGISMTHFKANASVIFTDHQGKQIDTFVIFDTDEITGLTHINHENQRVPATNLVLHSKTVGDFHMPLADAFSFEMLSKLKEKYRRIDEERKTPTLKPARQTKDMYVLAKAS